ncbi:hypothetical protein SUGI_0504850 [Cryptomeria japonica]|nr:hypothetical protein SUGI_0504850 [Cryptomeria japonica]
MCYPSLSVRFITINSREADARNAEYYRELQRLIFAEAAQAENRGERIQTAVEGSSRRNLCVCSPSAHAGSFRCRLHRSSYVWGRRRSLSTPRSSSSQMRQPSQ